MLAVFSSVSKMNQLHLGSLCCNTPTDDIQEKVDRTLARRLKEQGSIQPSTEKHRRVRTIDKNINVLAYVRALPQNGVGKISTYSTYKQICIHGLVVKDETSYQLVTG